MNEFIFRSRQYAKMKFLTISTVTEIHELYANNETIMLFTNRQFVIKKYFNIIIHKMITSIKIRGIETAVHNNFEYVILNFYIFDMIKKEQTLTHITTKIHLIDNLKINAFLRIDVLILEEIIMNFELNIMIIFICETFMIKIVTKRKFEKIIRLIRSLNKIIVSIDTIISISIRIEKFTILIDKNYNFFLKIHSALNSKSEFFAHVIELNLIIVQMRNTFKISYVILKNFKMSNLQNYVEKECYLTRSKNRHLAIISQFIDIKKIIDLSTRSFISQKTILFTTSSFMMMSRYIEK